MKMNRRQLQSARDFIKTQNWRFAKTMPQWPHWYIVAGEGNRSREFGRFATLIERFGENDRWGQQTLRYLRVGNYKYWVMGEIINRAAPIPSSEVRRRGEEWLRKHGKRIGPYGRLVPVAKIRTGKEEKMKTVTVPGENEEPPEECTTLRYKQAFAAISDLPENYLSMLRFHYAQPARTTTATQMANAVRYKSFRGANRHYARLGELICDNLGWKPQMPLAVLVKFDEWGAEIQWIMRPQVAEALRLLGWV